MNRGTNQNILTQLSMTSDEYNFVNTVYYVTGKLLHTFVIMSNFSQDPIYRS